MQRVCAAASAQHGADYNLGRIRNARGAR